MTSIRAVLPNDRAVLERRLLPRDDVLVRETPVEAPQDGTDTYVFDAAEGPFRSYRRTVRVGDDHVEQLVEYRLAIPYWAPLFNVMVRRAVVDGVPPGTTPWWSTPNRLSPRQSSMVAAAAMVSLIVGALAGLLTQVLTFVAPDLGTGSSGEQATVLAVVRLGVVLTVVATLLADRVGRRGVALWCLTLAVATTFGAALAPTLWMFTVLQLVGRNLAVAGLLCVDTIVVEELPAGSRAMVAGLSTLAYGLGAGLIVMALPLADLGPWGWRLTFVVAAFTAPLLWHCRRHLPESRRHREVVEERESSRARGERVPRVRIDRRRLVIIGAMFFLLNVFLAPASQLQNDYLRTERDFDGTTITVFTLITGTPAGLGVLLGGRVADLRGRRAAIVPGIVSIAVFGTLMFSTAGAAMWLATLAMTVLGGLSAAALGVIAAELFPTQRRGGTRGTVNAIAVGGSVAGLVLAGWLADSVGYGMAFTLIMAAPLIAAAAAFAVPETRARELEDLN